MPLNPITGQFEYGGESYNMPTMGAGMAAAGMETVGADIPLAFRLMENMPGITAMALFNARRFANTMEKGGYRDVLDPDAKVSRGKRRRANRVGAFLPDDAGNVVQTASDKRFLFGSRRNVAGKTPFVKPSLANNAPRFRNLLRNATAGHLSGMANAGQYTLFQGMTMMDSVLKNRKFMQDARAANILAGGSADDAMLSGGVLGRLTTMGRSYEATMSASKARFGSGRRSRRALNKANKKLTGMDRTLNALGQPQAYGSTMNQRIAATAGGVLTKNFLEDVASLLDGDMVSKGVIPKHYMPYDATAPTASQARYRKMFADVLGDGTHIDDMLDTLDSKTVRKVAGAAFRGGERKIGFKLAGRYGAAQYAKVAGPLNIVGTAAVVYDLGKMAATGVVSAGNFAKEAVKSMQGSMRKPLFGMGYQDNEVAATSRSRGVMAIQNSRLNARSMLGSEASMMAAHFG